MVETIDRNGYRIKEFLFKDFTKLSLDEIKMVHNWRNSPEVRRWMYNREDISYESHLSFIEGLKNRDDCYYWLVYRMDQPFGVYDIRRIDRIKDEAENGLYLNPELKSSGFGYDFVKECFFLFFGILNINRLFGAAAADNKNALYIDSFLGFDFNKTIFETIDGHEIEFLYSDSLTKEKFMAIYYGNSTQEDFINWYRKQKRKR